MSTNTLALFLRHLALSEEVNCLGVATDRDLLAAYESGRGEAAFTELVRRYGPLVLRTCHRVLGRGPDAEDAFQATFVLLARKAGPLRREAAGRLSLGGWLHRVAHQTALNVLAQLSRRRARERQAGAMSHPDLDPAAEATWNEVRPILDAELDGLPEEPRRLLIACYVLGKTHAEAAAELGLPLGSLARRLEKARALLAARLARRGISVSAALLATLLHGLALGAGVPARLLVHTVAAAVTFTEQAAGAVPERVALLVKGRLATTARGPTYLSLTLTGTLGLLGAGLIACQTLTAWPARTPPGDPTAAPAAARPAQEADRLALTDRIGDPLPPGALARLGTLRFRNVGNGRMTVLFTRDGRGVITAGRSAAYLWAVATGKLVRQFGDSYGHPIGAVALSPDGRVLAGRGGPGGSLRLWEVATGKLLAEGKGEPAGVACLAFSPDGKRVASGGSDNQLRLWDAASGRALWARPSATGCVSAVAFSPDGKTLAAVEDRAVSLWDADTGQREPRRWAQERPLLSGVAFSPDGRTLAVASGQPPDARGRDCVVCLLDVATFQEVRQLAPEKQGVVNAIQSVAIAPGGKVLATGNGSGEVRLWDMGTGKELRRCQGGRCFAGALGFSADGKMLAAVDGVLVRLWDTASGKERAPVEGGHRRGVSTVAFTPDGRTLISSGWDGSVREWDAATGEQRRLIWPAGGDSGECALVGAASAVAPDSKTLALLDVAWPIRGASFSAVIRLWDRRAAREVSRFSRKLGDRPPDALALSPDGQTVACVPAGDGEPGEVQLWESATGKLRARVPGGCPALSPDGKLLATTARGKGGEKSSVTLWEAATARELCSVKVAEGQVYRLGFSPDGRLLAAASDVAGRTNKHALHLWPLYKGESPRSGPALRLGPDRLLAEGLAYGVWAFAFSPDGRALALPDDRGSVRVLETATGKERLRFTGHLGQIRALAFSPDGRRLASGSEDTTVLVWDVTGRLPGGQPHPAQPPRGERE
jgi:RNA polymerase sigma factor (sigma-70 family)